MAVPWYSARAARIDERHLRAHLPEPDYTRPLLELTADQQRVILEKLTVLYLERTISPPGRSTGAPWVSRRIAHD